MIEQKLWMTALDALRRTFVAFFSVSPSGLSDCSSPVKSPCVITHTAQSDPQGAVRQQAISCQTDCSIYGVFEHE